jgi:hypothetical protein
MILVPTARTVPGVPSEVEGSTMDKTSKHRLEWGTAIALDATLLITGIGLIIVAKTTAIPDTWAYVGFFIAAVGLVGELILGVARADQMSHNPTNLRPHQ